MKRYGHIVACLLLSWFMAGCGESNKKPDADNRPIVAGRGASVAAPDETPGDPREDPGETMPKDRTPAPREAAAADSAPPDNEMPSSQDGDFDLFEEGLQEQMVEVKDPLEGLNRIVFKFNDMVYTVLLEPLAKTYEGIVSEPVRVGVDNFFENVTAPARYVNCLLQGKGQGADIELRRFLINSTEGILGFGNPARDKYGLEPVREDLGQTLAVWGIGDGFYLVLPVLGPSTLRDSVGMVGDYFLNPVSWVQPLEVRYGATGLRHLNKGSFHVGEYKTLVGDALDPYIMLRQSYMQYRAGLIKE
ncbi:MAG TPA: VacJ family lipoprotein [Phycisphaerales bacterium]|nr:VacJ family lipoprotein [Phycisphaerales bacterium]